MGGLVQNSNEAIFKNCKKLYEIGEDSLPPLIEAILPHDWSKLISHLLEKTSAQK